MKHFNLNVLAACNARMTSVLEERLQAVHLSLHLHCWTAVQLYSRTAVQLAAVRKWQQQYKAVQMYCSTCIGGLYLCATVLLLWPYIWVLL